MTPVSVSSTDSRNYLLPLACASLVAAWAGWQLCKLQHSASETDNSKARTRQTPSCRCEAEREVQKQQGTKQEQGQQHSAGQARRNSGTDCAPRIKADPYDPRPRSGYLSWDDYFMAVAFLSAERSKDPNKQVGACIVNTDKVILGIGYNGFPRGCSDVELPWAKASHKNDPLDTKYPYVVHAEANALLNKNSASVQGASVYVTMFPCNECAKLLIQAGIREVVYHEGKMEDHVGLSARSASAGGSSGSSINNGTSSSSSHGSSSNGGQGNGSSSNGPGNTGSHTGADTCYIASQKLLRLAGVVLRQHRLQRAVTLPGQQSTVPTLPCDALVETPVNDIETQSGCTAQVPDRHQA